MATISVGTCGFYYTDWLGPVYPEGTAKKDYLPLYDFAVYKTLVFSYSITMEA